MRPRNLVCYGCKSGGGDPLKIQVFGDVTDCPKCGRPFHSQEQVKCSKCSALMTKHPSDKCTSCRGGVEHD